MWTPALGCGELGEMNKFSKCLVNEYNLYNTVYKKIKDKDATFNYLKKANGNSLEIGWQLGLLKDDIKTYLADVVKANDEYLKTEKLIFEFGDFNSRQEEVFDRIRPVIEEFFSRSKFIKEVIILLDYKHPFWDRTFFI